MVGVRHVLLATGLTVNAIFLQPLLRLRVPPINVVTYHSSSGAMADRAFAEKLRRIPILIKIQITRYFHSIDTSPRSLQFASSHANDPITDLGFSPDDGHAAREGANPVERIRGKPEVVPHDVYVDGCHDRLTTRRRTGINRLSLVAAVRFFERTTLALDRVDNAVRIPINESGSVIV